MCPETVILKGDNSYDLSKKTSLFITCLVMLIVVEKMMLHVACNAIFALPVWVW